MWVASERRDKNRVPFIDFSARHWSARNPTTNGQRESFETLVAAAVTGIISWYMLQQTLSLNLQQLTV